MNEIGIGNDLNASLTQVYCPAHPGLRPVQDFTYAALTIIIASLLVAYFCPGALADANDGGIESIIYEDGANNYIIGPGDRFKLNVYENGELADEYRVGPDGKVAIPMAGVITASGHSRESLAAHIADRLGRFISRPMVTVLITEYNNNFVNVFGDTSHPGQYSFQGEIGMLSLISRVGDVFSCEGIRCDVIRGPGTLVRFDIADRSGDLQNSGFSKFKLHCGDSVYFTSKKTSGDFVYIMGSVRSPGMFKYTSGENISSFIKRSAGVADLSGHCVKILRLSSSKGEQLEYDVLKPDSKNPKLNPGDVIYVSEKNEGKVRFHSEKLSPGVIVAMVGAAAYKKARE